jgi:putative membrane protein
MKPKVLKSILSVGLAAILSFAPASMPFEATRKTASNSAISPEKIAEIKSKDEVIYAKLSSDGSVCAIFAINHFTIAEAGSITDYGNYSSVTNLTDTSPVTQNGDAVLIETNKKNFYYQGDMDTTELPWIFDISYSLDGVKTAPWELAGKSGELRIRILTKRNAAISADFYDNYMLQISITLDSEKCGDIKSPGSTIASAGKNKVVTYTVMPGKDADISLNATVTDFIMTGIDISAVPFSTNIDLLDTDSLLKDFTELTDAISDLNDGVGELVNGVDELNMGVKKLTSGSSDIKAGLSQLSDNSGQLIQASSQIRNAIIQIDSALNSSTKEMDLGVLTHLPQGMSQLIYGLGDILAGLIELKNGFASSYAALDESIQGIPDTTITQEQIAVLYNQTDTSQHGLLDQLIASYTAGQTVKGTYNLVKGAFDAVAPTIDTLSDSIGTILATLDEVAGKMSDALPSLDITQQIAQLSEGLSELDRNYIMFHDGLKGYMSGVSELTSGYDGFHNGLSAFRKGIDELYDGVARLHDGTTRLCDETGKIPETMQVGIDEILEQYTGSDFEPISFTSSKNQHTDLVQFVLKCEGIEKTEKTKSIETEARNETFWDRLFALFKGGRKD